MGARVEIANRRSITRLCIRFRDCVFELSEGMVQDGRLLLASSLTRKPCDGEWRCGWDLHHFDFEAAAAAYIPVGVE
jgi:hypothetical protein